ncbi:hypothetical protein [Ornithinimicrobium cerasi]|uniref:Uncharacterized protein n=1 Tax=Ornithinimicrobium cerasi TaxID=2248773 RepID=A0A285VAE1_9MICO|nr:hypothetical protein [Ornithinimicrobium cerasi]SOC51085.1 hypothetical protein SAMN05421879_10117 [Ornithinimicrobium cerasi]
MARTVAVVGLALAVLGSLLMVWGQPPLRVAPTVPVDYLSNFVLALLPMVGRLLASVGAVTIAFAVLIKVTGRSPITVGSKLLFVAGLALVLVAMLAEAGLVSYFMNVDRIRMMLAVVSVTALAQAVGAALLSLWLTGLLTTQLPLARQPVGARDTAAR